MALTRTEWEKDKNEFIETPQMLERHLVGYDIIKRLFTDEQILKYTRLNLTVYSQYHSTCLAQWVGDKDYKLGCSGHVWVKDYDEYGRELETEHQIPRWHAYVRADRISNYVSEVGENCQNIFRWLSNGKVRELINDIDFSLLYLAYNTNSLLYGKIDIKTFKDKYEEFDSLLFHNDDSTGNYFSLSEKGTNRLCNNKEYFVDLERLVKYISQ